MKSNERMKAARKERIEFEIDLYYHGNYILYWMEALGFNPFN